MILILSPRLGAKGDFGGNFLRVKNHYFDVLLLWITHTYAQTQTHSHTNSHIHRYSPKHALIYTHCTHTIIHTNTHTPDCLIPHEWSLQQFQGIPSQPAKEQGLGPSSEPVAVQRQKQAVSGPPLPFLKGSFRAQRDQSPADSELPLMLGSLAPSSCQTAASLLGRDEKCVERETWALVESAGNPRRGQRDASRKV